MRALILSIALLAASPAMAEHKYAQVGSWRVGNNDDGTCSMLSEFDNKTVLQVKYNQRLEATHFTFLDSTYASLKTGDLKTLELQFIDSAGKIDRGWGAAQYRAAALDNGARMLFGGYKGSRMLKDLRTNSVMTLFYKDTIVESLNLKGITPAVDALEKCATEEAKTHPIDIFAGE